MKDSMTPMEGNLTASGKSTSVFIEPQIYNDIAIAFTMLLKTNVRQ